MPVQERGIDLIAYDSEDRAVLLVETKNRRGTSAHWAARLRRNLLSHRALPAAKYFLIATPERIYLWKQEKHQGIEVRPQFTIDASIELRPYFEKFHQSPSDIVSEAFDLLILTWLTDISELDPESIVDRPNLRWLADSGLLESLRQARIQINPA